MPESRRRPTPWLVPDLHLVVQSGGEEASAHLRAGEDGLVLDVDRPATLLAAVGPRRRVNLPPEVLGLLGATPVDVRSQGRDLGRVTVGSSGRIRARPTPAGLAVAGHIALRGASLRVIGAGGGLVLTVLVFLLAGRRRRRALR